MKSDFMKKFGRNCDVKIYMEILTCDSYANHMYKTDLIEIIHKLKMQRNKLYF